MSYLNIDKTNDTPLYIQIRDNIKAAIDAGDLKPGDRLPPVAGLAKDLGVTQATIRRALKDLGKEGHTTCHVGRGTFIEDASLVLEKQDDDLGQKHQSSRGIIKDSWESSPREYAARRMRMGVSKALIDILALADRQSVIKLTRGVPDPGQLPENFLLELTQETLATDANRFAEATEPRGLYELRVEIARRYSQEGLYIEPDQVLITNGSMQAITLAAQVFSESRQPFYCETPCFKGVTDTFAAMGHWVDTITRDKEGPLPELLERIGREQPALLYLCPYAHNPMGTTISKGRYKALVDWAKKTGSVILADEIFKDICFTENKVPSLAVGLGLDQTIIFGSLSKAVMSGLRVGWLISSQKRIQQISELKRLMDHSCPSLSQGIAHTLFSSGKYDEHTAHMRLHYKKRMKVLTHSLEVNMPPGVRWSTPDGGFSMLLELPPGYSSVALFLSAVDKGVSFLPGPLFDIDQRFVQYCRLSCAWADEGQIKEGIELLSEAVEEMLKRPAGESGLSGLGSFQ